MKLHPRSTLASTELVELIPAGTQDPSFSNSHFVHAGQVFVSSEATSVALILGSCVGVCIWDFVKAIGGATHFMLPNWDGRGVPSARYASVAISILLQKLRAAGPHPEQLPPKAFGGGCLFGSPPGNGHQEFVGESWKSIDRCCCSRSAKKPKSALRRWSNRFWPWRRIRKTASFSLLYSVLPTPSKAILPCWSSARWRISSTLLKICWIFAAAMAWGCHRN